MIPTNRRSGIIWRTFHNLDAGNGKPSIDAMTEVRMMIRNLD